jgi:ribonuclease VapC
MSDTVDMGRLTEGLSSKSEKMRVLAKAGYSRGDIARYLGTSYQFVRNVLLREEERTRQTQAPRLSPDVPSSSGASDRKIRLGPDGQIKIPAALRQAMGLKEGDALFIAKPRRLSAGLCRQASAWSTSCSKIDGARSSASGAMASAVLDSSAVLAVLNDERGADAVIAALGDALVCAVNHAEIVTKLVEKGMTLDLARSTLEAIGVQVLDFDIGLAERTGDLRRDTEAFGLSLGDRACLALAEREGVVALTGDKRWAKLSVGIDIRLFR